MSFSKLFDLFVYRHNHCPTNTLTSLPCPLLSDRSRHCRLQKISYLHLSIRTQWPKPLGHQFLFILYFFSYLHDLVKCVPNVFFSPSTCHITTTGSLPIEAMAMERVVEYMHKVQKGSSRRLLGIVWEVSKKIQKTHKSKFLCFGWMQDREN